MNRLLEKGMAGLHFVRQDAPGQCPKGVSLSLTVNTGQMGRAPAHSQLWASGDLERVGPGWWLLLGEASGVVFLGLESSASECGTLPLLQVDDSGRAGSARTTQGGPSVPAEASIAYADT